MAQTPSDDDLYSKFEQSLAKADRNGWVIAVFEGSPEGKAYSWCSDCIAASGDVREFLHDNKGPAKVVQFKIGTKMEWEGKDGGPSPFKARFPHLSDLPTAILFRGRLDVARTLAPRKEDLAYLSRRAEVLEEQIKDSSWNPPLSA